MHDLKFDVLDHGFVRVVDYMGSDAAIVQAARVSYGAGTKTPSSDAALINYLMRHRHTSPFEMCTIKLHLSMPIFVARQLLRHRTASVNEISGRYSELESQHYVPAPETYRSQFSKSAKLEPNTNMATEFSGAIERLANSNKVVYQNFLDMGTARELARMSLTLNTYTEMYWQINLHNLLHFLELRLADNAQLEIREYAKCLLEIVKSWCPITYDTFKDHRLNAFTLSGKMLEVVRAAVNGQALPNVGLTQREYDELIGALRA